MEKSVQLVGKDNSPTPATPEEAAAKRASDREQAASRIKSYLMARIVNPKAARAMPDIVDLQMLLDERKQLYTLLEQGQLQQVRTLALVLHCAGVDSVEIPESAFEQLEGCSIRQSVDAAAGTMTLELVRPVATDGDSAPEENAEVAG